MSPILGLSGLPSFRLGRLLVSTYRRELLVKTRRKPLNRSLSCFLGGLRPGSNGVTLGVSFYIPGTGARSKFLAVLNARGGRVPDNGAPYIVLRSRREFD